MGLTITDETLAQMIRDLAQRKGVTPDEALREVVEREAAREAEVARKVAALMAIVARTRDLPRLTDATDDELLGYDEDGLPS
jgi:antitoxin VapB